MIFRYFTSKQLILYTHLCFVVRAPTIAYPPAASFKRNIIPPRLRNTEEARLSDHIQWQPRWSKDAFISFYESDNGERRSLGYACRRFLCMLSCLTNYHSRSSPPDGALPMISPFTNSSASTKPTSPMLSSESFSPDGLFSQSRRIGEPFISLSYIPQAANLGFYTFQKLHCNPEHF